MHRPAPFIVILAITAAASASPPVPIATPMATPMTTPVATSAPVIESRQTVAARSAEQPSRIEDRPIGLAAKPAAPAAATPSSSILSGDTLRSILALAGVVLLAVLAGTAMRSYARKRGGLALSLGPGGRAPSGVLEVLGRYPVGSGVTLVLLKLDRRVLLLSQATKSLGRGGGAAGFTTLAEITDADEVASILAKTRDDEELAQNKRFTSMLRDQNRVIDDAQRRVDAEPKRTSRPMRDDDDTSAEALVERLRGQIPVVDLTTRPSVQLSAQAAAERRDWQAQQTSIRQRLAAARESMNPPARPRQ